MSKGVQLAIATISLFVGVTWFLANQADGEGTFAYYKDVDSFLTGNAGGGTRALRVHGFVVEGSIQKDLPAGHVDFAIRDDATQGGDGDPDHRTLRVRYLGIDVPDLFTDGAEVVVEGRAGGDGFLAERVMAKCPSKYEIEVPAEAGI